MMVLFNKVVLPAVRGHRGLVESFDIFDSHVPASLIKKSCRPLMFPGYAGRSAHSAISGIVHKSWTGQLVGLIR